LLKCFLPVADRPVGPEVGRLDFERVAARFHCGRHVCSPRSATDAAEQARIPGLQKKLKNRPEVERPWKYPPPDPRERGWSPMPVKAKMKGH
jgi:hypothetical protein